MSSDQHVVIVGAGIAGHTTAASLAAAGFAGRITVFGDEPDAPYDRPPLSKAFLAHGDEEPLRLPPLPGGIDCVLGDPVETLDLSRRTSVTRSGRRDHWDHLVLATGTTPRRLPISLDHPHALILRSIDQARSVRAALQSAQSILLVGAGPIGLEVAAFAAGAGKQVTVVEAGERVMSRCVPALVSDTLLKFHRAAGVDVRLGTTLLTLDAQGGAALGDGSRISADVVIVGIGVTANDELARHSGIETRDGILVDDRFHTNVAGVFAVGDVARMGGERRETWGSAREQGAALARIIIDPAAPAYNEVNWFWSDQGGIYVQSAGFASSVSAVRGDPASHAYSILHWEDDALCGVTCVNAQRDFQSIKKLVAARAKVPAAEICSPSSDLNQMVKALKQRSPVET